MPTFSSLPPPRAADFALTLVRVPAGPGRKGILTSSNLVGTYTHWWGGRTQPCEDANCSACKEGMPRRWHAYVSAWTASPSFHYLLELTRSSIEPLIEYRDNHGTLRGCYYEAHRATAARNSRLRLSCRPADTNGLLLPREPNLIKVLAIIWSLPTSAIVIADASANPPEVEIDNAAAFAAATAASVRLPGDGRAPTRKRLTVHRPDDEPGDA